VASSSNKAVVREWRQLVATAGCHSGCLRLPLCV